MTRYLVHVAEELLDGRELDLPDGFRFVEAGPREFLRLWRTVVRTVVVEDDGAPPELAGKLVEPIFKRDYDSETTTILERWVVR